MSFKLFPSEYYDSTYSIDFEKYYNDGYRGVIFDIDNTLVPHNAMHDDRSRALFKQLDELGMKYCFVSNNGEERVKKFNDEINGTYVYKAGKPKRDGYLEAMRLMGTKRRNTFFVGDQIFTDIWGANNARLHCILVKQVAFKEEIQIYLKRIIEKPILLCYLISRKLKSK